MRYISLTQTEKTDMIIDREKWLKLYYIPELNEYFMSCIVCWIADYERYYKIGKSGYELYLADKGKFYAEFSDEISQKADVCFGERFVGAAALRDYDGAPRFQDAYPMPDGVKNPWQGCAYVDGIFYARIVWRGSEILVPPLQTTERNGLPFYPQREKCELQADKNGRPICYKLRPEYY